MGVRHANGYNEIKETKLTTAVRAEPHVRGGDGQNHTLRRMRWSLLRYHYPPVAKGLGVNRTLASSNIGLGAPGALLAGVAWVATGILDLLSTNHPSLEEGMFTVALLGTLGGLVGLRARQARRYGWLGTAGFLAAFIGSTLLLIGLVLSLLGSGSGTPGVASPDLIGAVLIGTFIGYVLLGVATLRAKVLSSASGLLLIVCLPVAIALGNYGGGIALGLVWLVLGYLLLSQDELSTFL